MTQAAKDTHTHIGGQAVIEGVMMRGLRHWAITVRRPDGSLEGMLSEIAPHAERMPLLKLPVFRGILALWEALSLAMKALSYSATMASDEDVEIGKGEVGFSMVLGVVLAVGLFVVLPAFATNLFSRWIGHGVLWNVVDGVIRVGVFVSYLAAIGLIPDIRRVFEYHGAEHKTIHAFEHGVPLEPEAIQRFSTSHVRCGTSFLLVVMVLAIAVFSFITGPLWLRIAARVLLIPLIAGLSYEVTKWASRYEETPLVRVVMWPGLALQAMTTREPDDGQVEVAVASLRRVVEAEAADEAERGEAEPSEPDPPQVAVDAPII